MASCQKGYNYFLPTLLAIKWSDKNIRYRKLKYRIFPLGLLFLLGFLLAEGSPPVPERSRGEGSPSDHLRGRWSDKWAEGSTSQESEDLASDEIDIDIDAMFESEDIVEETKTSPAATPSTSPVTFGGEVNALGGYGLLRQVVFDQAPWSDNFLFASMYLDNYLDIRLAKGIKSYLSTTLTYIPSSQVAAEQLFFVLNEFFIDFNINYGAFFRLGKQVAKWGRGFFWNPTDLINEDRKQFSDLNRTREGSYGLRLHIPAGTVFNFYAFWGATDVTRFSDYALSLRAEVLWGNVELGFLSWLKPDRRPIFGGDLSFGLRGINFYGEGTFHQEHTRERNFILTSEGLSVSSNRREQYFGKAVIGGNKSFKRDTISLGMEFYYNGEGHDFNTFTRPLAASDISYDTAYYTFDHNQWYGALFLTLAELFKDTTTVTLNGLVNFFDGSVYLSPWIVVEPVDQFQIAFTPLLRVGNGSFTEMTFESENPLNNVFLTLGFLLTLSF